MTDAMQNEEHGEPCMVRCDMRDVPSSSLLSKQMLTTKGEGADTKRRGGRQHRQLKSRRIRGLGNIHTENRAGGVARVYEPRVPMMG